MGDWDFFNKKEISQDEVTRQVKELVSEEVFARIQSAAAVFKSGEPFLTGNLPDPELRTVTIALPKSVWENIDRAAAVLVAATDTSEVTATEVKTMINKQAENYKVTTNEVTIAFLLHGVITDTVQDSVMSVCQDLIDKAIKESDDLLLAAIYRWQLVTMGKEISPEKQAHIDNFSADLMKLKEQILSDMDKGHEPLDTEEEDPPLVN